MQCSVPVYYWEQCTQQHNTLLMFPSTPKLWKLQWNELFSRDLRLLAARPKVGKIRISWYLPAAAMLCCLRGEKHRKVLLLQIIYFEDAKCVESYWDRCEEPSEPVPGDRMVGFKPVASLAECVKKEIPGIVKNHIIRSAYNLHIQVIQSHDERTHLYYCIYIYINN